MLRAILLLIISIFVLAVFRLIAGTLMKGVAEMMNPAQPEEATPRRPAGAAPSASTELRKDPVCGTFVPIATSVKKTVHGEAIHFCSNACRDKYTG